MKALPSAVILLIVGTTLKALLGLLTVPPVVATLKPTLPEIPEGTVTFRLLPPVPALVTVAWWLPPKSTVLFVFGLVVQKPVPFRVTVDPIVPNAGLMGVV